MALHDAGNDPSRDGTTGSSGAARANAAGTGGRAHPANREAESPPERAGGFRCGAGARPGAPRSRGSRAAAGLPVTVKSSISAAGYRCEIGSTLLRGSIPDKNAVLVERLLAE